MRWSERLMQKRLYDGNDDWFCADGKRRDGEVGMTIEEWAKDFKSYVNEAQLFRDDYEGIMEFIDDGFALLKEQQEEIENLKQTAQSIMEGLVVMRA